MKACAFKNLMKTMLKGRQTLSFVALTYVILIVIPVVMSFGSPIYQNSNRYEFNLLTNNHLTVALNLVIYLIPLIFGFFGATIGSQLINLKHYWFTRTSRKKTVIQFGIYVFIIAFLVAFIFFWIEDILLYLCYDHASTYGRIARLFQVHVGSDPYYEMSDLFLSASLLYNLIWFSIIALYAAGCALFSYELSLFYPKGVYVALGVFAISLILMVALSFLPAGVSVFAPQNLFNPRGVIASYSINQLRPFVRVVYCTLPLAGLPVISRFDHE